MSAKRPAQGEAGHVATKRHRLKYDPCGLLSTPLLQRIEQHAKNVDEHCNKDGVISQGDLLDFVDKNRASCNSIGISDEQEAMELFGKADLDGNGFVSTDEYCAVLRAWHIFGVADTNKDGKLSVAELAIYLRKNHLAVEIDQEGISRSHRAVVTDFLFAISENRNNSWCWCCKRRFSVDLENLDTTTFFSRDEFCRIVASWMHRRIVEDRNDQADKVVQSLGKKVRNLRLQGGRDFLSAAAQQIGQQLQVALQHHCFMKRQTDYACRVFGLSLRLAAERFTKMVLVYRGVDWKSFRSGAHIPDFINLIDACVIPREDLQIHPLLKTRHTIRDPYFVRNSEDFQCLHGIRMMTNPCLHDTVPDDFTAPVPLSNAEQLLLLRWAELLALNAAKLLEDCRGDPDLQIHPNFNPPRADWGCQIS